MGTTEDPNVSIYEDLGGFFVESDGIFGCTSHLLRRKAKVGCHKSKIKKVNIFVKTYLRKKTHLNLFAKSCISIQNKENL